MSTETITLTRNADEWIAVDEDTGAEGRGATREQALRRLTDADATADESMIVKTPETLGGKPRIDGTRIGVFMLDESIREGGQTIADVLEGYPHLSREQVEAALAYYDAHTEAMDVIRTQREAAKDRLREHSLAPDPDDSETEV